MASPEDVKDVKINEHPELKYDRILKARDYYCLVKEIKTGKKRQILLSVIQADNNKKLESLICNLYNPNGK